MRGSACTAMTLAAWLAIGCGQILGFEEWSGRAQDVDASLGGAGGVSGGGGAIDDANAEVAAEAGPSCVPPTPLSICEPVQQCGCPAGQACSFVCDGNARQWKTSCGVSSNGTHLQTCMGDFHCASGLACVTGACRRMCQSAEDCSERVRLHCGGMKLQEFDGLRASMARDGCCWGEARAGPGPEPRSLQDVDPTRRET